MTPAMRQHGTDEQWPGEPPAHLVNTSMQDVLNIQHQESLSSRPSLSSLQRGHESQNEAQDSEGSRVAGGSTRPTMTGAGKRATKRNALSCAECRRLKLKCTRVFPCTSCIRRKCAHICPDEVLKDLRPSRSKEINDLQARIHDLENRLAKYGDDASGLQSQQNFDGDRQYNQNITPEEQPAQFEGFNLPANEASHPGAADIVEVMGTLMISTDGSSRYLGKSAANALLHEGHSDDGGGSVGSDTDDDDAHSSVSGLGRPSGSSAFPWLSRSADLHDFQPFLPPFKDAQALGKAYFFNCSYMYEPIRRDVFESHLSAAYDTSYQRTRHLTLEQLAVVFMVLSLGVFFDVSSPSRDPRILRYHNLAQNCLSAAKFLNIPSLASIQCLHLMSTWHLSVHSQTGSFRAWPLLGLAGRMVLSTGLHRDGSIWSISEPDLSIRRQLFWEIISYDRQQSLILGRPYMLSAKHFDTEMLVENTGKTDMETEVQQVRYQFATIVGDLCDDCFSIGRPAYSTILRLDKRIRAFKQSLPAWLAFDANTPPVQMNYAPYSPELFQLLHQHAIAVQIHVSLLVLNRVAFAQALEFYPSEPLKAPWAQSVVSLCLEAARTLIAVARSAHAFYRELAARCWHIQIHAFGAAVCFAAICIKAPGSALTKLAWTELCAALDILEQESKGGNYARDLAPRLRKLRDQAKAKLKSFDTDGTRATPDSASFSNHTQGLHADHIDLEEMAVLGTATRKLDFNKPSQTARNFSVAARMLADAVSHGSGSSGSGSTRSSPAGAAHLSPLQNPSRVGNAAISAVHLRYPQTLGSSSDGSDASMQVSNHRHVRPGSPSLTAGMEDDATVLDEQNDNLQTYVNLDPELARMLASVSGTNPLPSSAAFPSLARDDALPSPSWIKSGQNAGGAQSAYFQTDPASTQEPQLQRQQHQAAQQTTVTNSFKLPSLPKLSRHPLATEMAPHSSSHGFVPAQHNSSIHPSSHDPADDPLPPSQRSIAAAAAYAARRQAHTQPQFGVYDGSQPAFTASQTQQLRPVYLHQPQLHQDSDRYNTSFNEAQYQAEPDRGQFYHFPSSAEGSSAYNPYIQPAPIPSDHAQAPPYLDTAYPGFAPQQLSSDQTMPGTLFSVAQQGHGIPSSGSISNSYNMKSPTAITLLPGGLSTSGVPPHSGLRMYDDLFSTLGVHEGGFVPSAPSSTASGPIGAPRHGTQPQSMPGRYQNFGQSGEMTQQAFPSNLR